MKTIFKCACFITGLVIGIPVYLCAQADRVLIHSHNDYHQQVPFYQAYGQQVFSIEADVFSSGSGAPLVGHDRSELKAHRTLARLYISPIVKLFKANGGRAWLDSDKQLVLLIDLKTSAATTLGDVVSLIAPHPDVFDERVNPYAVRVVISGDMPDPADFASYPPFIWFDGRIEISYTEEQLGRIAFVSGRFGDYATWSGEEPLAPTDRKRLSEVIDAAHHLGKKIRFWGTPDGPLSWDTLHRLGVDLINTDRVEACTAFFAGTNNR